MLTTLVFQIDLTLSSKHTVDSRKDISSVNVPSKPGKYVIPQRRKLNPTAPAFVPSQRPQRDRNRPAWMKSTDWLVC